MTEPTIISRTNRADGYIETLDPAGGGELYYRSCAGEVCRYSSDLWQAELYLDQIVDDAAAVAGGGA